ncbi:MAG TPA: sigma-E factor negative regulatory protein [Gammaproteobacteria bacterium]
MSKIQDRNESISCFMDGELDDHTAILDKLNQCNETKSCWQRYHLIRETLRDNGSVQLSEDFSSRVMQALANEPVILNPRFSRYRIPGAIRKHMLKPVAGLAIAASVAAATVVTMQAVYLPNAQTGFNVATTSSLHPIPDSSTDDASRLPIVVAADGQGDEHLNSYLLEHMEHSAAGGVQGMMPYVRLAGFENGQ